MWLHHMGRNFTHQNVAHGTFDWITTNYDRSKFQLKSKSIFLLSHITSQSYDNPEDTGMTKKAEIKKDERVERVRRAHMNDLENIPAFLFAAFFYILTEPNVTVALVLIRIAVIARILHTIVSHLILIKKLMSNNNLLIGLRDISNSSTSSFPLLFHLPLHHHLHDCLVNLLSFPILNVHSNKHCLFSEMI